MGLNIQIIIIPLIFATIGAFMAIKKHVYQTYMKVLTTSSFALCFGYLTFFEKNSHSTIYFFVGCILASFSDYFLNQRVFFIRRNKRKAANYLMIGLSGFLIGYSLYSYGGYLCLKRNGKGLSLFTVIPCFILAFFEFVTFKKLKSKMVLPVCLYLLMTVMFTSVGIELVLNGNFPIGLGFISIYISDAVIAHNLFRKKMDIVTFEVVVNISYYVGKALLVLSL